MEQSRPGTSERSIALLSTAVRDQIAAGEVVERPAAALKELIENAVDAGSSQIRVSIAGGGLSLLEVADDGQGIRQAEISLALERYATSKIREASDLWTVQSFGFRGEALAAIASVSRISIHSRHKSETIGTEIVSEFSQVLGSTAKAREIGTTVRVEELFGNTPARLSFMKSLPAETSQARLIALKLAMAHPSVGFRLEVSGQAPLVFPAITSEISDPFVERLSDVFARGFHLKVNAADWIPFSRERGAYKVKGYLLPTAFNSGNSRGIHCFVGGRAVRDRVIQQAVIQGVREVLFGGEYPQAVVFLEADPAQVDVNVHPAKAEVRFREPSPFGLIRNAVLEALRGSDTTNFVSPASNIPTEAAIPQLPLTENTPSSFSSAAAMLASSPRAMTSWAAPSSPAPIMSQESIAIGGGPEIIGSLKSTYILCQDQDGLLLIDQHAAHERIEYERLKKIAQAQMHAASPLLIPITIHLDREKLSILEANSEEFKKIGFEWEAFGEEHLKIQAIPTAILDKSGAPKINLAKVFVELAENLLHGADGVEVLESFRRVALYSLASASCHGSVRAGQRLGLLEIRALLDQMSETDFAGHCPHGRPTSVRISFLEIEKLFKRRV